MQRKISLFLGIVILLFFSLILLGGAYYYRYSDQSSADDILRSRFISNLNNKNNNSASSSNEGNLSVNSPTSSNNQIEWEEFNWKGESVDLSGAIKITLDKVLGATSSGMKFYELKIQGNLLELKGDRVKTEYGYYQNVYNLFFNGQKVDTFYIDTIPSSDAPPDMYSFDAKEKKIILVLTRIGMRVSRLYKFYIVENNNMSLFTGTGNKQLTDDPNTIVTSNEDNALNIYQIEDFIYVKSNTFGTVSAGGCGFDETRISILNLETHLIQRSFLSEAHCQQQKSHNLSCCDYINKL